MSEKRISDLRPGDILLLPVGLARVIGEPFLGQSGASVFDKFELFWRVKIASLDEDERPRYMTWGIRERVTVQAAQ